MTPEQRNERKDKGKAMCDWFEGRQLPFTMQLRPGVFANNLTLYVNRNINGLKVIDVDNRNWVLLYMRLYEVKKNIESQNIHNDEKN